MEEQEVARSRFLEVDKSWAKIGNIQTRIRIWTEKELFARTILRECLNETIEIAEQTMIKKEIEAAQDWFNSMGEEEENLPEGWKNSVMNTGSGGTDQVWLEKCGEEEKLPEGWKSSLNYNGSCGTGDHAPTDGADHGWLEKYREKVT